MTPFPAPTIPWTSRPFVWPATWAVAGGKLADGDDFGARYFIRDQGQITLHEVLQPGTWALAAVAMGLFGVFAARR